MPQSRHYRAAGGIVLDEAGRVLLIERDVVRGGRPIHEIRLPKGKLDPGETDEQAALREVGEETGYWHLQVTADLGEDTIEYVNDKALRTVRDEHYFLMKLTSDHRAGQDMHPGSEEALFEPRWAASPAEAAELLTYDGEKRWIERAIEHLR